jgi:hypothetical protein
VIDHPVDSAFVQDLLDTLSVQPGRCDSSVFQNGVQVVALAGPRAWMVERFVREVRRRATAKLVAGFSRSALINRTAEKLSALVGLGAQVDWHYAGGIAIVLADSDRENLDAVFDVTEALMPSLREAAKRAVGRDGGYALQIMRWGGRRPPKPDELKAMGAIGWAIDVGPIFPANDNDQETAK